MKGGKKQMEKTKFEDLSGWLKAAIVMSWILGGIFALTFIVEFIVVLLA